MSVELHHGDCLDVMRMLDANSVDTVITDPPAGIAFMGKKWDNKTGYVARTDKGLRFLECGELLGLEAWEAGFVAFMIDCLVEAYRVAKPGAMFLIWALPRTADLTGLAMRVAGIEPRNVITHIFGSGFPKSHDISAAIDKAAGVEREVVGKRVYADGHIQNSSDDKLAPPIGTFVRTQDRRDITAPATPAAKLWDGYGTALKPAVEFWLLGMKPLDGTFASNALTWGCAGLNIDGGRIDSVVLDSERRTSIPSPGIWSQGKRHPQKEGEQRHNPSGRFPSNLILSHHPQCVRVGVRKVKGNDRQQKHSEALSPGGFLGEKQIKHSSIQHADPDGLETIPAWECHEDCPVRMLDAQSGNRPRSGRHGESGSRKDDEFFHGLSVERGPTYWDTGGASRFFLNLPGEARFFYQAKASKSERNLGLEEGQTSGHPTVKPLELMKYLCTLTKTPTGGVVLDLFMGSGTTGVACIHTGRSFVGIEREAEYFEIAQARIEHAQNEIVQLALI